MRQNILKIAFLKYKELSKKYDGFINIILDDWRGFRFIFDTKDVRRCKNNCLKCALYLLLKNEKRGLLSAGLYPASRMDKKIFGRQNFLNCKTLKQYKNCYLNFILKKSKTKKETLAELNLIKNLRFIYSSNTRNLLTEEKRFKKSILKELLIKSKGSKREIIKNSFIFGDKKERGGGLVSFHRLSCTSLSFTF